MGRQTHGPNYLPDGSVASDLSGSAQDVVQARDISGGVHFHTTKHRDMPIPRQLPADVPGFVGRAGPLELLATLAGDGTVTDGRLIVIAGTPGAGKTALALRFAHRQRTRFPDGQLFVNLRGYDDKCSLEPGLPRSTGFGPVSSPFTCTHARGVQDRPRPVELAAHPEFVEDSHVHTLPDPGIRPLLEAPVSGAVVHPERTWQRPPSTPAGQHQYDRAEHRSCLDRRGPAAL